MKRICFYHSADLDGHCSGAIVAKRIKGIELRGIDYGDQFPWEDVPAGSVVYMVDFCLQPFSDMVCLRDWLRSSLGALVWVDHHKSAIDAYVNYLEDGGSEIEGNRHVEMAGCELTWKLMFPQTRMPDVVRLLGRHDVWDHRDPDTEPLQYGMRLHETRPEKSAAFWAMLLEDGGPGRGQMCAMLETGKQIMRYQRLQDDIYARSCAFVTRLDGLRLLAVNRACANSKAFDGIWPEYSRRADVKALFAWHRDRWKVILYSEPGGPDVSIVAKAHGGGGHRNAAGFTCAVLPFETGQPLMGVVGE